MVPIFENVMPVVVPMSSNVAAAPFSVMVPVVPKLIDRVLLLLDTKVEDVTAKPFNTSAPDVSVKAPVTDKSSARDTAVVDVPLTVKEG